MKVLKFGGTSVADSKSINNVISILKDNDEPLFIIVSALGGITNLLQKCIVSKGKSVDTIINEIEQRHLEVINNLSSLDKQSSLKSFLKQRLNELEDILDAISTINESRLQESHQGLAIPFASGLLVHLAYYRAPSK